MLISRARADEAAKRIVEWVQSYKVKKGESSTEFAERFKQLVSEIVGNAIETTLEDLQSAAQSCNGTFPCEAAEKLKLAESQNFDVPKFYKTKN